jgi:hypothetical protein
MHESLFSKVSCFLIYKRDLLKARVVIQSYNDHIRLLPSRALVGLAITKFTRVEGAGHCYEINEKHIERSQRFNAVTLPNSRNRRLGRCSYPAARIKYFPNQEVHERGLWCRAWVAIRLQGFRSEVSAAPPC